jgi:mono/diheme cytochrome c family protein
MLQPASLIASARRFLPAALLVVMAGASPAQEIGDAQRGKTVATAICAECHAIEPGAAASPNPKATRFEQVANTSGITAIALTAWLQSSHPTMPNIKLSDTDMRDVIQYILSLQRE